MTDPTIPGLPDELVDDRSRALEVACPSCGQPVDVECRRLDGRPLEYLPAHPKRLAAAGVLHAPLDPRELRADPYRRTR